MDDLMEKYLEEGEISAEEMETAFNQAIATQTVIPILCCSSIKDKGVEDVFNFVAKIRSFS